MRFPTYALLACALMAGCGGAGDPLAVDGTGAARAVETPPDLEAVAEAMDQRRGQKLTDDLTILGAEARGRRLDMRFRDDRDASAFGPAAREIYAMETDREIRTQMCAQPALRRFVEEYDGVSARIVSADDAPLAEVLVEAC